MAKRQATLGTVPGFSALQSAGMGGYWVSVVGGAFDGVGAGVMGFGSWVEFKRKGTILRVIRG